MNMQEQLALLKQQAAVTNDLIEQMKDAPEEQDPNVMYDGTPHGNAKKFFMYDDPIAAWFGKVIHNVAKRI